MSDPTTERFVTLVWDALKSPECIDRSALLSAANAFLDAIGTETGPTADIARKLGNVAMDQSVFGGDISELRWSAKILAMHGHLTTIGKRIARLEH
ncbi:hypothetical protein KV112_04435 [Mycolicibacter sp. MYC123]|uniref:Uncharacterized protein n=1 Tax=[Mycobacterium] zoologicum TaxID=2872311 RepID=A0ABU5YG15_9MYCO|nr:hypothetical protein [Mycolicibacter sp. MYC123]MEB3048996.1 hypothetical protein [Mycolicibacter sp. MYC123]